ncbi:MAG: OmpA family protein [Bacteroidales bacterium]|jgi:outer membrane protein OmpA-like peptidoglycan-associated protein|nr:OmpA family protein [Bacteroidales bacterium]
MMRIKWSLVLGIMLLFSLSINAQNGLNKKAVKYCEQAKAAINASDFEKAQSLLHKAYLIDTTYSEMHILMGDIFSYKLQSALAAECYLKAIRFSPVPKPLLYFLAAGEEVKCGRYQEAYNHYQTYIGKMGINTPLTEEIDKNLKICRFGIEAIKNPVNFEPINLGGNINSTWDEYLAALTADEQEFIFTVARPRDKQTACAFCLLEEDFYSSKKINGEWQPRQPIEAINTHHNEGAQCISPDGKYLFYTICNSDFGYGSCDLYWSKRIGDRWSRPRNFGEPVNSKYWESQPAIGPDGKTIYFTSNRPGGRGKLDLWKTEMKEEGVFTVPVNLGATINTPMDETAPFIHADGKTLYFASDGHPGLGGKDLFYSILLKDGNWSEPTNLGYPINTYADEINILISASGTTAYFSSDIEGGYGGLDLYYFTLDERLRPTPVTYLKGTVKDATSKQPLEAHIEMIDLETNQVITATQSDPKTGEFLACILTGTNVMLNVSHPYYPFYSENFQLKKDYTELKPYLKDIELHKPDVGNTFILRNIFFDFDKSELKPESFVELNNLVLYLKENYSLKIEIGGHTDNQGSAEYNQNLSLARARSVYSYLISKGIDSSRLSYAGYGMSVPITDNSNEEGRASNRRTEFKVVE